jgi:hypothetical protein
MLERRTVVQSLALLAGFGLSPLVSQLASAADLSSQTAGEMQGLSAPQLRLLDALVETIIPETETPGAREAGVASYINSVYSRAFSELQRDIFTTGLDDIEKACAEQYSIGFEKCSGTEQIVVLTGVAAQAANSEPGTAAPVSFFLLLKELTVIGYYTSEIGATQELRYQAVPGSHEQCITLGENRRAWFSTSLF